MNEYLDKLLGDEGLKTDITVSLAADTYLNLGATIVLSMVVGMVVGSMAKKALIK